jgi:hypothetical protein
MENSLTDKNLLHDGYQAAVAPAANLCPELFGNGKKFHFATKGGSRLMT